MINAIQSYNVGCLKMYNNQPHFLKLLTKDDYICDLHFIKAFLGVPYFHQNNSENNSRKFKQNFLHNLVSKGMLGKCILGDHL